METDHFDPASLLEFAMEENDSAQNIPNISFEDPEMLYADQVTAGSDGNEIINGPEERLANMNEKEDKVDQNASSNTDNYSMCSVPISMFHLFNLNNNEFEEEQEAPVKETNTECPVGNVTTKIEYQFKKATQVTPAEKTFRKNLFKNDPNTILLFKLHCSICNKHIGSAPNSIEQQLRVHRELNVIVCTDCHDFYGVGNFPVEDGSEIYCLWCGQGGTIICCSNCPKVFCESCITLNFGLDRKKEIEETSTWACFICSPTELWPHRAVQWGLQRLLRSVRMKIPYLGKEELQKLISVDTSDCCSTSAATVIKLPSLVYLQKIPLCLFAAKHCKSVVAALNEKQLPSTKTDQSTHIRKPVPKQKVVFPVRQKQNQKLETTPVRFHIPEKVQVQLNKSKYSRKNLQQEKKHNNTVASSSEVICVDDDVDHNNIFFSQPTSLDLSWLQKVVKESSHALFTFQSVLNTFDDKVAKLQTNMEEVEQFVNKLHSLFRVTIQSLAVIDHTMLQELKACKTVKEIRFNNYSSITFVKNPETAAARRQEEILGRKVEAKKLTRVASRVAVTPGPVPPPALVPITPQESGEEEDLNCLLFCETVMTEAGDGNKENEFNTNNNKDTRITTPQPVVRNLKSSKLQTRNEKLTDIPTIVLDDDEPPPKRVRLTKQQYDFYYKKFNLKPCKVLLFRCETVY